MRRSSVPLVVLCLAGGLTGAGTAARAELGPLFNADTYAQCLADVRKDPGNGFEEASAWVARGGGLPAEHCAALALVGLKQYADAALHLDHLETEMGRESPTLRAQVLNQSAEAWLEANEPDKAYATLTNALAIQPDNADLHVSRAVAAAQAQDYKDAIDDLNRALALVGPRADALAYRAAAYRFLGDLKQAEADANRAVSVDPTLPEAYLERANVRRLLGNANGARADWVKILQLAPNSAAADAARDNIEKLDVHVEEPAIAAEPPK